MRFWPLVCKLLQRQTYTFLSTRHGLWIGFIGLCIIVVSAFHFGEVVLEWSMLRYAGKFHISRYYDNIGRKSFESRICLPQPIDIVYTWVNGSDPILITNLNKIRKDFEVELNKTRIETYSNKKKRGKLINSDLFKWKDPTKCPFPNCMPASRIAVSGLKRGVTIHQIKTINGLFNTAKDIEFWDEDSDVSFILFDSHDTVVKLLNTTCKYKKKTLNISEVFYTSTIKNGHRRLESSVMIHHVGDSNTVIEIQTLIDAKLPKSVLSVKLNHHQKIGVVHLTSKVDAAKLKALSKKNLTLNKEPLGVFPVTYVWSPVTLGIDNTDQDFSRNRYADNDELRYSLRSVEKFVPWVRKIFIVTNGQIPSWLNLDHPRIQLVTHEEIFLNKSHLPTFSSPAIEAHIHRIPGLSKKFIYMNDDVFFGAPVWPDDFFTHSKGHKIYLSWAVPNCNEGCPASWVNDKYCDKACNVSACDYDGGDCIGKNAKKSWQLRSGETQRFLASRLSEYCYPGCALNWVGDRYCDGNCNHLECAFDGGDCGVNNFKMLFSFTPKKDIFKGKNAFVRAPKETLAMYVNFTNIFDSLVEGSFTDTQVLRNAVISKKFKILSITFFENVTETAIDFQVLGYRGANQTDKAVAMFTINVTTIRVPKPSLGLILTSSKNASVTKESIPRFLYNVSFQIQTPKQTGKLSYPSDLFNMTVPQHVSVKLQRIRKEFENGDLTVNGYNRSLGLLYEEHLKDVNTKQISRKLLWIDTPEKKAQPRHQNMYNCFKDPDCILSFLPWENGLQGKKSAGLVKRLSTLKEYKVDARSNQRHLLDAYSSSLLHVSRIYNKAFGYKARKVPAHMPHMVDRDVIYEMQGRFRPEFDATSSHKLRHPQDMQFAFSFNYYVIGVKKAANVSELFDEIDTDKSGVLNDRELRTLTAILYPLPISINQIHAVEGSLKNCSSRLKKATLHGNGTTRSKQKKTKYYDPDMPLVTKQLFVNCHEVWRMMNKSHEKEKHKHEIMGEDDLAFKMIGNNVSMVLHQLDWIRKNRRKFICVNDDIDHDREDAKTVRKILRDFYESFFPVPSQFELKTNYKNRFLYKKHLDSLTSRDKMINKELHFLGIFVIVIVAVLLLRNKIMSCLRTILRLIHNRGYRRNSGDGFDI